MIRFEGVVVRYPAAARSAVNAVSFDAQRAALTAIVGPNGSGKSTLVRALLRRVDLAAGRILVDDVSHIALAPADLARRVAVVPQREEVTFPLAVEEYVALGRFPHLGVWRGPTDRDRQAIAGAMEEAGISHFATRSVGALSGGEWQRVRLARALAQGGDTLVLDEPTAFLDVGHEMAVFELLRRLSQSGRAVLVVSHQLNLVARFADAMVLLSAGEVAAMGAPEAVMRAPILERVYEWPLVVSREAVAGAPMLVPLRSDQPRPQ